MGVRTVACLDQLIADPFDSTPRLISRAFDSFGERFDPFRTSHLLRIKARLSSYLQISTIYLKMMNVVVGDNDYMIYNAVMLLSSEEEHVNDTIVDKEDVAPPRR
jgi:hypothetical protein